jgi:hypothetical protein
MADITNNIQESNQDIINDIQYLQQTEQGLFNSLETNPNLTTQQQEDIMTKINQITNMRISLYQTLSNVNGYFQDALKTSHGTLQDQSMAIQIVEDQLNQMKKDLQLLQNEKNNKIRLVEINSYYGDKYAEHAQLMKIIIFTLVPVIIVSLIYRSGLIPQIVYTILICIIALIGGYFFWKRYASIITRDAMDYNEYDWYFDASSAPTSTGGSSSDPWLNSDFGTCIGQECCSTGQVYDASSNLCISSSCSASSSSGSANSTTSSSGSTSEDVANHILTQTSSTNKYKHSNQLSSPPKPSNSESFITYPKFR